jgi:hypothetical protein
MSVPDFGRCGSDVECMGSGSACVTVHLLDGIRLCLPACEATADCPADAFCYPDGGPYPALAGRCFYSYCGQSFDNGETSGACRIGAELEIPTEEQLDGWCYPFRDGAWGLCIELGSVAAGGTCDPPASRCRGDGCRNCGAGTVCIDGVCEELCDPLEVGTGSTTCPGGEGCWDRSELHVFSNDPPGTGTWGTCQDGTACQLFGDPCPDGSGGAEGCLPTTPVRANGFCDPGASGDLAPGAACAPDQDGDPYECQTGALCITESTASTCQLLCDLEEVDRPCPDGSECLELTWSSDPAIETQGWGTCR